MAITLQAKLQKVKVRVVQDLKPKKKPLEFAPDVIERVRNKANGVPRQIIAVAREIFRIVVSEDKEITSGLLKEITS